MRNNALSLAAAAVLATGLAGQAEAGSRQSDNPVLPIDEVSDFADQMQAELARRGAHVAIVSRIGRDPRLLPDGIRYTHVGFWVYADIAMENGQSVRGYAVYNLYQRADDLDVSDLVQDYPADFFAGAHALDAGVIIPDPRLQAKLLEVITSPTYEKLHNPRYSVIANPENGAYQNCTEHTLDVLMAALYDTDDPGRIQANIRAHFTPQTIDIDPIKRLLGPLVIDGVAMDDQSGTIRTSTFTTIARFMADHDLSAAAYRMTPAGMTPL
ncbi:MAG: DUF2145 domain-containing protein [Rhizobiales bacterium]|nr:DUF2145 domain-containing protein [Hyphomicrobiales bacterium]